MSEFATNTFSGGMNMDVDRSVSPSNTYSLAENLRIISSENDSSFAIENIKGNKFHFNIPNNLKLIGYCNVRDYCVLFCTNNTSTTPSGGRSAIYKVSYNENTGVIGTSLTNVYDDNSNLHSSNNFLNFSTANKIKALSRYEKEDVQKVYFVDGYNPLRVINIADSTNNYKDVDIFNIIPNSELKQPVLYNEIPGIIKSGKIQYSYQLYNSFGTETLFSIPSAFIHVSKDSSKSSNGDRKYKGYDQGEDTNKGYSLSISLLSNSGRFNRIRLIAIHYSSLDGSPSIRIASDMAISDSETNIIISDNGTSYGEYSPDEVLIPFTDYYIPKEIEDKNDRLFASNIKINNFDIDFDARAYRYTFEEVSGIGFVYTSYLYNEIGVSRIFMYYSSGVNNWRYENYNGSTWVSGSWNTGWNIPEDHNCINAFNDQSYDNDLYSQPLTKCDRSPVVLTGATGLSMPGSGSNSQRGCIGGYGPNVAYSIVTGSRPPLDDSPFSPVRNSGIKTWISPENRSYGTPASIFLDYNSVGYQRDEVYRFGIVFFDSIGRSSFVKWIGDIRTPHSLSYFSNGGMPFTVTDSGAGVNNLAIKFYLRNIPLDAKAYQIVRVKRNESDKTVLAQGIISNTVFFNNLDGENDSGSNLYFPSPSISNFRDFVVGFIIPDGQTSQYDADKYHAPESYNIYRQSAFTIDINNTRGASNSIITFISPEVSVNKNIVYSSGDKLSPAQLLEMEYCTVSHSEKYTIRNDNTYDLDSIPYTNFSTRFDCNHYPSFTEIYRRDLSSVRYRRSPDTYTAYIGANPLSQSYNIEVYKLYRSAYSNILNSTNLVSSSRRPTSFASTISDSIIANSLPEKIDPVTLSVDDGGIWPQDPPLTVSSVLGSYSVSVDGVSYVNQMPRLPNAYINKYENNSWYRIKSTSARHSTCLVIGLSSGRIQELFSGNINDFPAIGTSFIVCNYKRNSIQYGGNTYSARTISEYIPCGTIITESDLTFNRTSSYSSGLNVWGGDTNICIYEAIRYFNTGGRTSYSQGSYSDGSASSDDGWHMNYKFQVYYIPLETTVNTHLFSGKGFNYLYPSRDAILTTEDASSQLLVQCGNDEDGTYNIIHKQDDGVYKYNSVYSQENISKRFFPKPLNFSYADHFDYRTYFSDKKIGSEQSDSWLKLRLNNYLDVNPKYGAINNVTEFKDKLFFWQDKAFGIFSVNTRSLIPDNTSTIQLGSGGPLDRYDYISTEIGNRYQFGLVKTMNNIYWYDENTRQIIGFGGEVDLISKQKGLNSFINKINNKIENVIGVYDYKNNDVLFSFSGNDTMGSYPLVMNEAYSSNFITAYMVYSSLDSSIEYSNIISSTDNRIVKVTKFIDPQQIELYSDYRDSSIYGAFNQTVNSKFFATTISYNEIIGKFNSIYTYCPDIFFIDNRNNMYTSIGNSIYKHNGDDVNYCEFYGQKNISRIIFSVNDKYEYNKVFDNISIPIKTSIKEGFNSMYGMINHNRFIDYIRIYTDTQNTDIVDLNKNNNITSFREGHWSLQIPRNKISTSPKNIDNINVFDRDNFKNATRQFKERIRDKYINVEIIYNNLDNSRISIPYIVTNYRISKR